MIARSLFAIALPLLELPLVNRAINSCCRRGLPYCVVGLAPFIQRSLSLLAGRSRLGVLCLDELATSIDFLNFDSPTPNESFLTVLYTPLRADSVGTGVQASVMESIYDVT